MAMQVEDAGKSEGRPVMGRIGVRALPHPKGGRLPKRGAMSPQVLPDETDLKTSNRGHVYNEQPNAASGP
jgi:hypothetical protein